EQFPAPRQPRLPRSLAPKQRGTALGVPARLHIVRGLDAIALRRAPRSRLRRGPLLDARGVPRPPHERTPREAELLAQPLTSRLPALLYRSEERRVGHEGTC